MTASETASAPRDKEVANKMRAKMKAFRGGLGSIRPVEKVSEPCNDSSCSGEISEIVPWLFIGSAGNARSWKELSRQRISHIVNLSPESKVIQSTEFEYLVVEVSDHSDQPIEKYFDMVHDFIEQAREQDGRVLVHCQQGISRSATIVISYLMKQLQIPRALAQSIVKARRPIINPNIGFVYALNNLQDEMDIDPNAPWSTFKDKLSKWSLDSVLSNSSESLSSPVSSESPPAPTVFTDNLSFE